MRLTTSECIQSTWQTGTSCSNGSGFGVVAKFYTPHSNSHLIVVLSSYATEHHFCNTIAIRIQIEEGPNGKSDHNVL